MPSTRERQRPAQASRKRRGTPNSRRLAADARGPEREHERGVDLIHLEEFPRSDYCP